MQENRGTIREHFLIEHRALEAIGDRLLWALEADAAEDVRDVLTELDRRLSFHLEIEEKWLLPRLAGSYPETAAVFSRQGERFRRRVNELRAVLGLPLLRVDSARIFVAELRAHAQDEDELLYRWLERTFDDHEKATLLAAIRRASPQSLFTAA